MALTKINNNTLSAITGLPAGVGGKVLQVVQTVKTNSFTTTSTTMTDITGFSVSITPISTSNKILIIVNVGMLSNGGAYGSFLNLLRDSTVIVSNSSGGTVDTMNAWVSAGGGGMTNDERKFNSPSITFLDSPLTTSAITYKCQIATPNSTQATFNRWGLGSNEDQAGVSTITAYEIAG